ncbi:hypothetical protein [Sneathiella litorea]|uniref:Uncharacterized protein n=1 Tax=Sneathiella litorea TaxID=2606216 RepID=A0A6L8WD20_9PROT|nr:hypothetical protein [Sneathiella litorea]MZR32293.1 hypothetical protein [Sneathiella litorea]
MTWRIVPRSEKKTEMVDIPAAVLTVAPQLRHENLPNEVGLLLPTNNGPRQLIDAIVGTPQICNGSMLGLFLADPLLNLAREEKRLSAAGVKWITNLPSTEQQDVDFSQQLSDVGLDIRRERDVLARLRSQEFRIAAVVSDVAGAVQMSEIKPEVVIVIPRVADFAAGFPSLHQRGTVTQEVSLALRDAGWSGVLLGLGETSELCHERQWPDTLDGLICRPELVSLASA